MIVLEVQNGSSDHCCSQLRIIAYSSQEVERGNFFISLLRLETYKAQLSNQTSPKSSGQPQGNYTGQSLVLALSGYSPGGYFSAIQLLTVETRLACTCSMLWLPLASYSLCCRW